MPPERNEAKEDIIKTDDFIFMLAVHVGAGYHSEDNVPAYKKVMKQALLAAHEHLKDPTRNAVDGVEKAIEVLELSPLTNAGLGSNLTVEGTVECDASIMHGDHPSHFGAVGALEGVKNPICVARKVLAQRESGLLSLGRIPPMLLVGEGARKFADISGATMVNKEDLVTEKSKQAWQKYTVMVQTQSRAESDTKQSEDNQLKEEITIDTSSKGKDTNTTNQEGNKRKRQEEADIMYDTVGAICMVWRKCDKCTLGPNEWCTCGHTTAAGVSSGGILMKFPGRVGEAAIYGSGCWAQKNFQSKRDSPVPLVEKTITGRSVACSTSGTGEQLMQSFFAMNCAQSLRDGQVYADEAIRTVFDQFLRQPDLQPEQYGGVIACQAHIDEGGLQVEAVWGHSTDSMAIGYFVSNQKSPKTFVSRFPTDETTSAEPGFGVTISSACFKFNKIT